MSNFGINRGQAGLIGRLNAAGGGPQAYSVNTPPVFDGTNDYMLRGADFTGNADSKTGILSAWLRIDGGDASARNLLHSTGSRALIQRASDDRFRVRWQNAAGSTILEMYTNTTFVTSASWIHLLAAWSLGTGVAQFVMNGASNIAAAPTVTNDTIDYTVSDYAVGALTTGSGPWFGAMAEVYFAPGQYLDISSAANVQKFRSSDGKPVDLGTDGSTPTGTAPILYLKSAYTAFNTNSGTGGNLSVTGAFTASATSPSD